MITVKYEFLSKFPKKAFQSCYYSRNRPVYNSLKLGGILMKPNLINKKNQILNGLLSEEGLLALHLQFLSASHFRHQMHMLLMLIPCLT